MLENEYDHMVKTLECDGTRDIVNLWERDNPDPAQRCVTVGAVIESESLDGVKHPKETLLTALID